MKRINIFSALLFIYFVNNSCTQDSVSDLLDISADEPITFNQTIRPIIINNCANCHGAIPSNGAPQPLLTYDEIKNSVLNEGLLDRISRPEGQVGAMPQGGPRLPQNQINAIITWSEEGFQE